MLKREVRTVLTHDEADDAASPLPVLKESSVETRSGPTLFQRYCTARKRERLLLCGVLDSTLYMRTVHVSGPNADSKPEERGESGIQVQ
jgi:hypothetical protein